MAVEVVERNNSGMMDDQGIREKLYNIYGTDDGAEALEELQDEAPATLSGSARRRCRVDPVWVDTVAGDGEWLGSAEYEDEEDSNQAPPVLEVGQERWSFNTQGGTAHMTQGLRMSSSPDVFERRYPAPGKQVRDYRGAIRVTREGIEGCDVPTGVNMIECTTVLDAADVDDAFRNLMAEMSPSVNDAPWRGYEAGEACFLGVRGGERADGDHELTFGWWIQKNTVDRVLGTIGTGGSAAIDKAGWEYLWVEYEEYYNSSQKLMEKRPAVAYVDKVVEEADFSKIPVSASS